MKRLYSFAGAALLLASSVRAQAQEFWRTQTADSAVNAFAVDSFGHSYVAGSHLGAGGGPGVRQLDANGVEVWSRTVATVPANAWTARAVGVDPAGAHVTIALVNQLTSSAGVQFVRYDAGGNLLWTSTPWIAPSSANIAIGVDRVLIDASGNTYLPVRCFVAGGMYLVSHDATGALRWAYSIDQLSSTYIDEMHDCAFDNAGNIVLAGEFQGGGQAIRGAIKVSPAGAVLWSTAVSNGTAFGAGNGVALDPATGRIFVCGSNLGATVAVLDCYDSSGALLWSGTQAYGIYTQWFDVAVDPQGFAVVAGALYLNSDPEDSSADALVAKYNLTGSPVVMQPWTSSGVRSDVGRRVVVDAASAITVATNVQSNLPQGTVAVLHYTPGGTLAWQHDLGLAGYCSTKGLELAPNGAVRCAARALTPVSTNLVVELADPPQAYCSGIGATACPCGNSGSAGHGCANSVNAAGAQLDASGASRISADTLTLNGSGMPDGPALYFQGTTRVNGGAGAVFGDGLRCADGVITRLGILFNTAGQSSYPSGGAPLSVQAGVVSGPATRTYQAWYRDSVPFCQPDGFNLTNGLSVTWLN